MVNLESWENSLAGGQTMTKSQTQKTLTCRSCGTSLSKDDEWWSHTWNEEPDTETVEEAIDREDDGKEFRDWFQETIILCPNCHKEIMLVINDD